MKVKVIIEKARSPRVEHVAEVNEPGDLIRAAADAMEAYRKKYGDLPLFDRSTIKIERA